MNEGALGALAAVARAPPLRSPWMWIPAKLGDMEEPADAAICTLVQRKEA